MSSKKDTFLPDLTNLTFHSSACWHPTTTHQQHGKATNGTMANLRATAFTSSLAALTTVLFLCNDPLSAQALAIVATRTASALPYHRPDRGVPPPSTQSAHYRCRRVQHSFPQFLFYMRGKMMKTTTTTLRFPLQKK
jgi:hypothetical protein